MKTKMIMRELPEHFPLQQGLKLKITWRYFRPKHTSWALSITTRIETRNRDESPSCSVILPEHFPLQQGLKREVVKESIEDIVTSWALSITTRIETRYSKKGASPIISLPEHFPLQQGLKLGGADDDGEFLSASWALSITTRIETSIPPTGRLSRPNFLSTFHYNKDWNVFFLAFWISASILPEHFPLQQGLKPTACTLYRPSSYSSWALSITTRIETVVDQ